MILVIRVYLHKKFDFTNIMLPYVLAMRSMKREYEFLFTL